MLEKFSYNADLYDLIVLDGTSLDDSIMFKRSSKSDYVNNALLILFNFVPSSAASAITNLKSKKYFRVLQRI